MHYVFPPPSSISALSIQLWSVFYPSWPALVLLLWACVIWLIPKTTPRNSLFYSSPILIIYSVCLLMLQYVYSLDLTLSELSPVDGLGQECSNTTTIGCKSFVPLLKVPLQTCAHMYFCTYLSLCIYSASSVIKTLRGKQHTFSFG